MEQSLLNLIKSPDNAPFIPYSKKVFRSRLLQPGGTNEIGIAINCAIVAGTERLSLNADWD